MAAARETVNAIRALLDRMLAAERQLRSHRISGDEMERIHDEVAEKVRHLPRQGILEAFDLARGQRRVSAADQLSILWHFLDQPEVVRRIGEWLESPDVDFQASALQMVGERRMIQFAEHLNPLIESAGPARGSAILAAGRLQCRVNLPALLRLADQDDPELELPLVLAMKGFPEDGQPYLLRVFERVRADEARPSPWSEPIGTLHSRSMTEFVRWHHARNTSDLRKKVRVAAAAGLAKLGNPAAIAFLLEMLYDPDESGPAYQVYGQSRNAAEALCDAFGWPVEPRVGLVERVRALAKDIK